MTSRTSFRKTFICLSLALSIFATSLCSAFSVPVQAESYNVFKEIWSQIDDTGFVALQALGGMVLDQFNAPVSYGFDEVKDTWVETIKSQYSDYIDPITGLYNFAKANEDGNAPFTCDTENRSFTINGDVYNISNDIVQDYCHRMDGYYLLDTKSSIKDIVSSVGVLHYSNFNYSASLLPPFSSSDNVFYNSDYFNVIPSNIGYLDSSAVIHYIDSSGNSILPSYYLCPQFNVSNALNVSYITGWGHSSNKVLFRPSVFGDFSKASFGNYAFYSGNPFMLFYTSQAYSNYANQGRQYYAPQINVPSITFPETIVNNGNISDLFHVEIGDRTGLSEEEIQKLLDDAVQKIIDGLQTTPTVAPTAPPVPTGDPTITPPSVTPPSGGGGSTTVVDLSGTNNLLSKILEDLNTFADENFLGIEQLIKEVQDFRESALSMLKDLNQKDAWDMVLLRLENLDKDFTAFVNDTSVKDSLDLILTRLANLDKDFSAFINDKTIPDLLNLIYAALTDMGGLNIDFTDLIQAVKDAGSGVENKINDLMVLLQAHWLLEGIGDIFDNLLQFISDRLSDVGHLIDTIVANVVGNLLSSLLDGLIGDFTDLTDYVTDMATGVVSDAVKKFPLCIPWDLAALIHAFGADPETPKFDIPITIASLNINENINIDLSNYEDLAVISRKFFMVLFLLTLTVQSRRLYGALMGVGGRD